MIDGWDLTDTDLHPDLTDHVRVEDLAGMQMPVVRHPLVLFLPYAPAMNKTINELYERKLAAIEEAFREEDWYRVVHMHERPYRLDAFLTIPAGQLSDEDYWALLSEIWTDSENISENLTVWKQLLTSDRPGRQRLMSETERNALRRLPETVEVFRGYSHPDAAEGMSWTVDEDRAWWFAARFEPEQAWVASARVSRAAVIAYLDRRGEQEILLNPEDLTARRDDQIV